MAIASPGRLGIDANPRWTVAVDCDAMVMAFLRDRGYCMPQTTSITADVIAG
jgi:hypothetical protein